MGIPRFFRWLTKRQFPGVLLDSIPSQVDWLVFDVNSMFYEAHEIVFGYGNHFTVERAEYVRGTELSKLEEELQNVFISLLSTAIVYVMPTQGILLAVDGVTPQAKIQQQRRRRYMSKRVNTEQAPEEEKLHPLNKPIVDLNRITPGTAFMFSMDAFIREWLSKPDNASRWGVEKILYSSHLVPGEGEHKYLELLRDGVIPSTGVHVVYGLDNDLFILGILSPVEQTYITRREIKEVVSILNLRYALRKLLQNKSSNEDFAVMTFLLGNDFLPRHPALLNLESSIELLLAAYKENGYLSLVENNMLVWDNFFALIDVLAKWEPNLLAEEAVTGFKYASPIFSESLKTTITYDKVIKRDKTVHTFYQELFAAGWYRAAIGKDFTEQSIAAMCLEYLNAIQWNLSYYVKGWQEMSLWYYYPFFYAPLFRDLAKLTEAPAELEIFEYPFGVLHQLISVLPKASKQLLPVELRQLTEQSSSIIDLYPDTFLIDREGTNYLYEGVGLVPFADPERVIEAVDGIRFPEQRKQKYDTAELFMVTVETTLASRAHETKERIAAIRAALPKDEPRVSGRGRGNGRGRRFPLGTRESRR